MAKTTRSPFTAPQKVRAPAPRFRARGPAPATRNVSAERLRVCERKVARVRAAIGPVSDHADRILRLTETPQKARREYRNLRTSVHRLSRSVGALRIAGVSGLGQLSPGVMSPVMWGIAGAAVGAGVTWLWLLR
ncbi:MAG: hypothetical protein GY769_20215 [bacterium]|nr:hypothetical protein [bacterium]